MFVLDPDSSGFARQVYLLRAFLFLGVGIMLPSEYIIERYCDSEMMGVFGRLLAHGQQIANTLEQSWRDNQPFISCIPAGRYEVVAYDSPKHGQTFALKNIALGVGVFKGDSQRYAILIHPANTADQLHGCIALGTSEGVLGGFWALRNSAAPTRDFLRKLREGDHITIIWKDHP